MERYFVLNGYAISCGNYVFDGPEPLMGDPFLSGVTVGSFEAEMTRASLTGVTLSFDSLPDREYEIQWTEQLGSPWQTVPNVPSQGEQTHVGVIYSEPEASASFFKM